MNERYILVLQRIDEICRESFPHKEFEKYFHAMADFLLRIDRLKKSVEENPQEIFQMRQMLYGDLQRDKYMHSYANPAYATCKLGNPFGRILSFLYFELVSLIDFACDNRQLELLIRMELFVEIYTAFVYEQEEEGTLPAHESIKQIIYWFAWDYSEMAAEHCMKQFLRKQPIESISILYDDLWDVQITNQCGISEQCLRDHAKDRGLILDRGYINRLLEVYRLALEKEQETLRYCAEEPESKQLLESSGFIGMAQIFHPDSDDWTESNKAIHFNHGQKQLWEKYVKKLAEIFNIYLII